MAKGRKRKPSAADAAASTPTTAGMLDKSPAGQVDLTPRKRRRLLPPELADERIVDPGQLLERIPLDRSTLWRMVEEGRFPAPIKLTKSGSRIGWRWSNVLAWISAREAEPVTDRTFFGRDKKKQEPTEAV